MTNFKVMQECTTSNPFWWISDRTWILLTIGTILISLSIMCASLTVLNNKNFCLENGYPRSYTTMGKRYCARFIDGTEYVVTRAELEGLQSTIGK